MFGVGDGEGLTKGCEVIRIHIRLCFCWRRYCYGQYNWTCELVDNGNDQ